MIWQDGLTVLKDPDSIKDWKWDFADWMSVGEQIDTHSVIAATGIVVDLSAHDTNSVTVWLSGGTAGLTHEVTVRINTNQGRTEDRTVDFLIDPQ